mgnify:CR=1 FL=1
MAVSSVQSLFQKVVYRVFGVGPAREDTTPPAAKLGPFLAEAIRQVEALVGAGNGETKKELVLQACELFYDNFVAPMDIPFVPNLIVEPYVDAKLRTLVRPLCGPLVDVLVAAFNGPALSAARPGSVTSVLGHDGRGNLINVPVDVVG